MELPPIKLEHFCEFPTFSTWVNKAASWTGGLGKQHVTLWLDKEGYAMMNGGDFMASRDAGRFPVNVYIVTRSKPENR